MTGKWIGAALAVGLTLGLSGCGGGGSDGPAAPPAAPPPVAAAQTASISYRNDGVQTISPGAGAGYVVSYSVLLKPSGVATYSAQSAGFPARTGTGVVPASLASRFFADLAAAQPLSGLPAPSTLYSSQSVILTVQSGGQIASLLGSPDARAQVLAADAQAVAAALGLTAPGP